MLTNIDAMIVGNEEWFSFPGLNIPFIKARVDSGAATSSIHALNIKKFTRQKEAWVSFDVPPLQHDKSVAIRCEAKIHDRRVIKSSSGEKEKRYVIKTMVRLASKEWEIELTLSDRESMEYKMLFGREAMFSQVIVDPSLHFVHGNISEENLNEAYGRQYIKSDNALRIGVLASNPDLYSNKRLMEAGTARGHEMVFLNVRQCYMRLDDNAPCIYFRGGQMLNDLDAIIPRIRPSATFYGCALIRLFESIKVFSLNSAEAITQSRDKLFALQLLLKNGLAIPTTGFANSPIDTNDLIEMVGGAPLIVKLLEGSQGRGVVLAETVKAAESVINAFKSLNANLLVQEFVKEVNGKDLRLFVIDGKVVAAMQRQAAPGEFRANIHQGGSASVVKITNDEKKLAIRAAKVLGLKVAGVDIIRSSKGPLLLEVNSSPGLEGIETATGKDIAGMMIESIQRKLHWVPKQG